MYNVVVIGGGIVGLASALKIKEKNPKLKVAVLEKEKEVALHQTGHNSGVIHSGLYYAPSSFKAKNCVEGYKMLLDFCKEEGIEHELCGKLVVATNEDQLPALKELHRRGNINGLEGIRELDTDQIKDYEPHVRGMKGLYVPQTGIIDYKEVASRYVQKFKHFGGEIFTSSKLAKFDKNNNFIQVTTKNHSFTTRLVVNCAGLYSDKVAKLSGLKNMKYKIIPFRGEYYKLKPERRGLVKNLVYPVPNPDFPFLGVHFTRHLDNEITAGPNAVLAMKREGYSRGSFNLSEAMESIIYPGFLKVVTKYRKEGFKELRRSFFKSVFTKTLQEIIPEIEAKDLLPAQAGVRAQACSIDGKLIDDFLIIENEKFINVCNAPSPAATSSLAIGERVAQLVEQRRK